MGRGKSDSAFVLAREAALSGRRARVVTLEGELVLQPFTAELEAVALPGYRGQVCDNVVIDELVDCDDHVLDSLRYLAMYERDRQKRRMTRRPKRKE